jgi:hypothetical protein
MEIKKVLHVHFSLANHTNQKSRMDEEADQRLAQSWMMDSVGWRVEIKDGRIFEGKCSCIDSATNLILENAREYRGGMFGGLSLST